MDLDRISVWFVCKLCQGQATFPNLEKFLSHKIDAHFEEFENADCIVFEESTNYEMDNLPMRNYRGAPIETSTTAPVHIHIKEEPQCIFGIGIDSDTEEPEPEPDPDPERNTITNINTEWVQDDVVDTDAGPDTDPVLDSADFMNSSASVALIPHRSQPKKPSSFSKYNNKPCPKSKKTNPINFNHDNSSSSRTSTCSTSSNRDVKEIMLPNPFECKLCFKKFSIEPAFRIHATICQLYNGKRNIDQKVVQQQQQPLQYHRPKIIGPSSPRPEPDFLSLLQTSSGESFKFKPGKGSSYIERPQIKNDADEKRKGRPYRWGISPQRKYQCTEPDCGKAYCSKQNLVLHIKYNHNENNVRRFVCKICKSRFNWKQCLKNHLSKVHNSELSESEEQEFQRQEKLCRSFAHFRRQNIVGQNNTDRTAEPEPHFLSLLQTSFPIPESDEDEHGTKQKVKTKASKKPTMSNSTGKRIQRRKGRQYRWGISPKRKYKCPEADCGKTYCAKQSLLLHVKYNHNENNVRRFECKFCGKRFNWKHVWKTHVLRVHNAEVSE